MDGSAADKNKLNLLPRVDIMFPWLVCFCGAEISIAQRMFEILKEAKYKELYGGETATGDRMKASNLSVLELAQLDMGDELDALGIDAGCCRTRIMTGVEYTAHYL